MLSNVILWPNNTSISNLQKNLACVNPLTHVPIFEVDPQVDQAFSFVYFVQSDNNLRGNHAPLI